MFRKGQGLVFQHDNARPHVARVTTNFLQTSNINILSRPARSPNWNPTEDEWDYVGLWLRKRQPQPANVQQLIAVIRKE